jgi:hypothetical protein
MVNMAGNSRQTSSNKMSKCNWTNELVNDLIDLVEEIEVIWNAKAKVDHEKVKRSRLSCFSIYGRTFSRSILNVSLLILI